MSARTVDVLIFIPLIPAIPIMVTWWLPWERWIPRKLPKNIIGPYLLYCSFAVWHFHGPWWVVALLAAGGAMVCALAISQWRRAIQVRDWPVTEGSVIDVSEQRNEDGYGSVKVTLTYTYKIRDERYGGSESFVFSNDADAARFKDKYKGRIQVRYQPDKPQSSVLCRE